MTSPAYRKALHALLTPAEHRLFARLDTPHKIQTFLDRTPVNFGQFGDTAMSPRRMLTSRMAHCTEGAFFAAAVLAYHAILRWRDPIYRSPRELAMSYAHEYCLPGGKKSMLAYSKPFSLARYAPKRWVVAVDDLDWLLLDLDLSPHLPVAPRHVMHRRRRSSKIELLSQEVVEWPDPRRAKAKKKTSKKSSKPTTKRKAKKARRR